MIRSALTAPYETRLRARLMANTIEEANQILATGSATEEDVANIMEMVSAVLIELGHFFAPVWLRFLDTLRGPGMPGDVVRASLRSVRIAISGTEQLLPILHAHPGPHRE